MNFHKKIVFIVKSIIKYFHKATTYHLGVRRISRYHQKILDSLRQKQYQLAMEICKSKGRLVDQRLHGARTFAGDGDTDKDQVLRSLQKYRLRGYQETEAHP